MLKHEPVCSLLSNTFNCYWIHVSQLKSPHVMYANVCVCEFEFIASNEIHLIYQAINDSKFRLGFTFIDLILRIYELIHRNIWKISPSHEYHNRFLERTHAPSFTTKTFQQCKSVGNEQILRSARLVFPFISRLHERRRQSSWKSS